VLSAELWSTVIIPDTEEVTGSIPVSPTSTKRPLSRGYAVRGRCNWGSAKVFIRQISHMRGSHRFLSSRLLGFGQVVEGCHVPPSTAWSRWAYRSLVTRMEKCPSRVWMVLRFMCAWIHSATWVCRRWWVTAFATNTVSYRV